MNGFTCASFQEVALKYGILQLDNSTEQFRPEVINNQTLDSLQKPITELLMCCEPKNLGTSWSTYYPYLSED